jgi:hypothetical protein
MTDALKGATGEEVEYGHGLHEAGAHGRWFPPALDPSPDAG